MNKSAIKTFAINARRKLIDDVTFQAGLLGITEKEIAAPLQQSTSDLQFFDIGTKKYAQVAGARIRQRNALAAAIREKAKEVDYGKAFRLVMEEVAYTWFNRLIAIRFMEVNDYLPDHVRVLSSENPNKLEPDIVTRPFDTDLSFTSQERDTVLTMKDENKLDELFRMLFIKRCDALRPMLPGLFEHTTEYAELLLSISFRDTDGVVYRLTHDLPEDIFNVKEEEGQVEIIGWLYQYYNDEPKNRIINIYKGIVKKEDIPAATQLFTTDWVVRYMVDNSLGRYWIERHPESNLAEKLAFFVTPKNGEIRRIDEFVAPEELKILDPCVGSGHILVYAFDVLMEIYRENGYTERDAAALIVQNNLFGLDIDNRAAQLAYFAVMMKARSYDRRFLSRGIKPNVLAIKESNRMGAAVRDGLTTDAEMNVISRYLVDTFRDAKELGSIITVEPKDYDSYMACLDGCDGQGQLSMDDADWLQNTRPLLKALARQAKVLAAKYPVVCTNPPYLNKIEGRLKTFVTENYKDYSGDLFSVFTYRNLMFCKQDGYCGYMTPFVWMFIKTYEKLRKFIIQNKSITTLVQMEYSAFEEATVPICSFVLKNGNAIENGLYFKLSDFKGGMEVQKQKVLEALTNKDCGYFYEADQSKFSKIPGSPVAYWVSENFIRAYQSKTIIDYGAARSGLQTGDNNRFLKFWQEVNYDTIAFGMKNKQEYLLSKRKWIPQIKGGEYRKWYGNFDYVVNWENDGAEIRRCDGCRLNAMGNDELFFKEGITWSHTTSSVFGARYLPAGCLFNVEAPTLFATKDKELYLLAFLDSCVAQLYLNAINSTMHYLVGNVSSLPVVYSENNKVDKIVNENIEKSKTDWDSSEISWDFKRNPLV